MKKHTEKQPLDDLFARKLENMSLPPSPDGFARLQARMGQGQAEPRVVFWRNPDVQRYMAIAACLLLVCLFGWRYVSNDTLTLVQPGTVAVNKPATSPTRQPSRELPKTNPADDVAGTQSGTGQKTPAQIEAEPDNSPIAERSGQAVGKDKPANTHIARLDRPVRKTNGASQDVPNVVPAKMPEQIAKTDVKKSVAEPAVEKPEPASAVAVTTPKSAPVAERVLVVTIAEPEALVAARQIAKAQEENKAVVAVADKSEKEAKPATLWQQMKRLKQGEVFARKDAGEDERGLIGRAYSGLKQTLDKDKPVKQ